MKINNILLRASAGTGKTFQLSNRYIALILDGTSPENILATTFTRKAAGEILERILQRLAAATISDQQATKLSAELGIDNTGASKFGDALKFLVGNLHRINVSTLDAYFAKLLTNHAYELGVGASWSIATAGEQAEQKRRAIVELLERLNDTESARLMRFINKDKYTRSILRSLDQTINDLISPFYQSEPTAWSSDLGAESSAGLLTEQQTSTAILDISNLLESEQCAPFVKTINSDLSTLRANDWDTAIKGGLFKKILSGERMFARKQLPDALVSAYLPLTRHVVALKIRELQKQTRATYSVLSQYATILHGIKSETNRLEFGDVPRLLQRGGRNFESAFRMDGAIEHLLLDEFQDTSLPQWNIIEHLALSITSQINSSFFCVGDVKQAIYGWRGGRREIFARLESCLHELSTDTLRASYRSSKVIVEFINEIFQNLDSHPNASVHAETLARWQKGFTPLTPVLEHDGYVEYINSEIGKDKNDRLHCCLTAAVDKAEMLINTNRELQIGILVRTNTSIAILIHLLAGRGIACSEDGGNPLSNYSAVQLILSTLSLIEHPENSAAQYHVYHSPLAELFGTAKERSTNLHTYAATLRFQQRIAEIGFQAVLAELVHALEPHVSAVQFTRLEHLLAFADEFTFSLEFRLDEFINAVENEKFGDPEASRIRVMTIHQAKGLEFDAVILPTLESSLAPQAPAYAVNRDAQTQEITDVFMYRNVQLQELLPSHYREACQHTLAEHVNESLCVLYVALTRAARALYLIGPCKAKPPKSPPLNSAGIIQMAILEEYSQTPNSIIFYKGDSNWFKTMPPYSPKPLATPEPLPLPLANVPATEATPLISASPSSLEGGERFLLSGVLKLSSSSALQFGSQLHFFMEQIHWAQGAYYQEARSAFSSKYGDISSELQSHLLMFMENGPLSPILTTDFYFNEPTSPLHGLENITVESANFTVHNEYPICATVDGTLLRGFVDRLVIVRLNDTIIAVDICDFKTDRVDGDSQELKERVSHYRPQINAYKKAIAQMFDLQLSKIGARLIFTHAGVHEAI